MATKQSKTKPNTSTDHDLLADLSKQEDGLSNDNTKLWKRWHWGLAFGIIATLILVIWSYLNFLCATTQLSDNKDANWLLSLFYGDRCNKGGLSGINLPNAGSDNDHQQLSLNGTSLSIAGGNTIDLTSLAGTPGPQGPAGANGSSTGLNGTNGTNGTNGAAGPAGPAGPPGPNVITNVLTLNQATGATSTVNGVSGNQAINNAAPNNLIGFDGLGDPVYDSVGNILTNNTTNLLTWTQAGGLASNVNGVISTVSIAGGTIANDIGYDAGGTPVSMPRYNWQVGANFGPNYTITDGVTWKATSGNNSIQTTNSGGFTTEFDVVISPNAGNSLTPLINGLYVPTFLSNAVTSINTTATGPNVDLLGTPNEINVTTLGNNVTFSLDPDIVCPGSLTTFCQNGNSFGATAVLGTNDNNSLVFETNGIQNGMISNDGLAIQFGNGAGSGASLVNTNFIGVNAGLGASGADNSNFIGVNAGSSATSATGSNFIGTDAGNGAINAFFSNFIGISAGNGATDANLSNFIGFNAGTGATNADSANFIGFAAGTAATNASHGVFIGSGAGALATNAANAVFIGGSAGQSAINTNSSVFIGNGTGFSATNAQNSIFIGTNAGFMDTVNNTLGGSSILIGSSASTGGFSNSIGLGDGATNTATNQFVLGGGTNPVNSIYEAYIGENDINAFPLIYANTTGVGLGMTVPTAQLNVAGSGTGLSGTAGIQWEGVAMSPSLSSMNAGRIYYNSTTQGFECSLNTGAYTPCISGTLNAADNGLSLSGTTVQFGQNVGAMGNPGQLLSNREIPYAGFNVVYDPSASAGVTAFGGPAVATKEVSIYGDLLVTGVIDPTALLFSPQTPTSYDPTLPMNNGYRIGVSATIPTTGMPGTQLPIYVSPLSDNTRVFEVRDAANVNTIFDVDTSNMRAGVRTASPNSTLQIEGSYAVSYDAHMMPMPITLDETYQTLVVTPGGGTITLPTAVGITGRIYTIKNESGFSITPNTTGGETIDGAIPTAIENANAKWYISDGSNWHSIASFGGGSVTAGAGLTNSGTPSAPILDVLADNGLQVDAVADRVRLGGLVGSPEASNAQLLFNTEVPLAGFNLNWTGAGNVGVMASGTNAMERLHVQPATPMSNANVLFEGQFGSGSTPAFPTYDTTMYWSPGRSAFRAGTATGMQWDNMNVGDYSTAFGLNTTASGLESMAWGENTQASNQHATAWGMNTTASGTQSTAWGMMSNASAPFSTSFGVMTTAMMNGATAWGESSDALGNYSTSWGGMNMMGMGPQAIGDYATAFGINTVAGGPGTTAATSWGDTTQALASRSTAWGQNTLVSAMATNGTAFGFDTEASGMQATAFGTSTTASGPSSTAWGNASTAWNMQATAFGNNTNASGENSTSFGDTTIASGENSTTFGDTTQALSTQGTAWGQNTLVSMMATNGTAFGFDTEASGMQATAFGTSSTASGQDSTSFGNLTTANGNQSTAFGQGTMAMGNYSTAFGLTNFAVGEGTTAWGTTNLAQGDYSSVWGTSTQTAMGATNSTAFGFDTEASAAQATSFGSMTVASGMNSTAFGDNTDATGISATSWGGANGGPTGPQATGDYSTAFGITTTASDLGSTAWGLSTFATNDYATAWGMGTQATGQSSTAFGMGSLASATQATAWGQMTNASAINATAFGISTVASGDQSTAIGQGTTASGLNSYSWGEMTTASADESTAWGNLSQASATSATAFGTGTTANAMNATSFGQGSTVSMAGINGTAFGNMTTSSNMNATAFGDTTTASGLNSTAFGFSSLATTDNATAWGNTTQANGNQSTAWGNTTNASAENATAFGVGTTASANQSTAFGALTTAAGLNGTAWGQLTTVAMTASNGTAFGEDTDAIGINSTAWGNLSSASGLDSTSFGVSTNANGDYSTAWGNTTTARDLGTTTWGQNSVAGDGAGGGMLATAFGVTTLAEGLGSTAWGLGNGTSGATGDYSTSFGELTSAIGYASTSWGGDPSLTAGSLASGNYSTAFGIRGDASGLGSTSFGNDTTASGQFSTVWGDTTTASSDSATAWGMLSTASSTNATAFGSSTTANGLQSTAFGTASTASNTNATAWGNTSTASGVDSTAWGTSTAGGELTSAWGAGTLAGGYAATSWGGNDGSIPAWLLPTTANGAFSTAFGFGTSANGFGSTTFGYANTAIYDGTTSWGAGNYSIGVGSTVWGQGNITGENSDPSSSTYVNDTFMQTILGSYAVRNGDNDDAGGYINPNYTDALADEEQLFIIGNGNGIPFDPEERSTAFYVNWTGDMFFERELRTGQDLGTYPDGFAGNVGDVLLSQGSGLPAQWSNDDTTFWKTLGNDITTQPGAFIGTTNADAFRFRTNNIQQMVLDINGNLGIGTPAPTATLDVVSTATTTNAAQVVANFQSSGNALSLTNTNPVRTGAAGTAGVGVLSVNGTGSDAEVVSFTDSTNTCTGNPGATMVFTCTSDARLKENIEDSPEILSALNEVKVRSYDWLSDGTHARYGVIAQELEQTKLSNLVHTNAETGLKSVTQIDSWMLVKGLQEVDEKVEENQSNLLAQLADQQTEIDGIKSYVGQTDTNVNTPTSDFSSLSARLDKLEAKNTQATEASTTQNTQSVATAVFNGGVVTGDTEFQGTATFIATTTFKGLAIFKADATFEGNVDIAGNLSVGENNAGSATVPAGATKVHVSFSKPYKTKPKVTATTQSFLSEGAQYRVANVTTAGFDIEVKPAQAAAINFDWTALE